MRIARRAAFLVHQCLGLVAGAYLVVVCTTGAALVFRIEMQRALYPHLFARTTDGPRADPATVLESVRDAFPEHRVSGIDAPTTSRATYLAYVTQGPRFLTLLVDPVTARVLGELPEHSAVRSLQEMHFNLLAGRTGRTVNGIGALSLAVMGLTGAILWWRGAKSWWRGLTVDLTRHWRRVVWDLHGATGIVAVAFLAMWAATGAYFAFPTPARAILNWLSPLTVARAPVSSVPDALAAPRPTWRALITRARQQVPGRHVARVVVPATDDGAFLVMFSASDPAPAGGADLLPVYLDRYTGAVLRSEPHDARSMGDVIAAWVAPLHIGNFGAAPVKIVWLLFGLAPAVLGVTGLVMWMSRRSLSGVSSLPPSRSATPRRSR